MSDHERKAIRGAAKTLLVDKTGAQDRVFASRAAPLHEGLLPAILIYFRSERSERFEESPRSDKRTAELVIEYVDKLGNPLALDDRLDAASRQIETAMYQDHTLGGLIADMDLTETTWGLSKDGETPAGVARHLFDLERIQQRLTDDELLEAADALETVHTDYETTDGAEASDTVELEQEGED